MLRRMSLRFLLLENIHPVAREILGAEGFSVETTSGALKESELIERVRGVHVLGIRSKTYLSAAVIEAGTDLVAVGAFCIGTNQIDLAAAAARGVPCFNAPFSNTRSVAELILAEVVALARELGDRSQEVHRGAWKKSADRSAEVRGKTLGIIGYGHIGRQIGVLAEILGMRVVFYDVAQRLPMGNNLPRATMAELLAESDFVTLHVPETPQTKGMFGKDEIAQMKLGAHLLNASRGTVVDIDALAAALREGKLGGAAIDVFPEEPEKNVESGFVTPLQGLRNVILTPHVGGSTAEAQQAIGREVAHSLTRYVRSGSTESAVNFPQVDLPPTQGAHRILHVHRNVPGVLRDVNRVVAGLDANIRAQILGTNADLGYLIMDLEGDVAGAVSAELRTLPTTIRVLAI